MSKPVSLLFVCADVGGYSSFQRYLERAGCRLTVVANTDDANAGISNVIDAVLIHDGNVVLGSTLASGLKFISFGRASLGFSCNGAGSSKYVTLCLCG
jgi:hypothetical protein